MTRPLHTIQEIKDMLHDRLHEVVEAYGGGGPDAYEDKGQWFMLSPFRADRSVGSFVFTVNPGSPYFGRWKDFSTGEAGDVLDLIRHHIGSDASGAIIEAKKYLGLAQDSPEDARRREEARARAKARRAQAAKDAAAERERKRGAAFSMWLSAEERIAGTPVEAYLRDTRGIDLAALGRQPRCLRYARRQKYSHTDPKTGEVIEFESPAMMALIVGPDGREMAVHRTWLAKVGGRWVKHPDAPKAKKVLGEMKGGALRIWAGTGPRGGKPGPLQTCPPGQRLVIAEGIEDALSIAVLTPSQRVWAAVSLGNMGDIRLPDTVSEVVLAADNDLHPDAQAAFARSIAAHRAAGRTVFIARNRWGGKDFNDALMDAKLEGAA